MHRKHPIALPPWPPSRLKNRDPLLRGSATPLKKNSTSSLTYGRKPKKTSVWVFAKGIGDNWLRKRWLCHKKELSIDIGTIKISSKQWWLVSMAYPKIQVCPLATLQGHGPFILSKSAGSPFPPALPLPSWLPFSLFPECLRCWPMSVVFVHFKQ